MSNTTQNLRRNYTSLVLAALQDSNFESWGFLLSLAVVIHHYLSRALRSSCYYGSALTATCGCLFGFVYKKEPTYLERFIREESSQRAAFFCGWWEYKLD